MTMLGSGSTATQPPPKPGPSVTGAETPKRNWNSISRRPAIKLKRNPAPNPVDRLTATTPSMRTGVRVDGRPVRANLLAHVPVHEVRNQLPFGGPGRMSLPHEHPF